MAHQSAAATRNLTLTEELEKLEQSVTLTLQEIDSNFSRAHRIITTSILPIVERYAKHSEDVWDGAKFWKQFFEVSANVSLSGYEERPAEDDTTLDGSTARRSPDLESALSHDDSAHDVHDSSILSSPSITQAHVTPKAQRSSSNEAAPKFADYPSPYETLKRELRGESARDDSPTTPGRRAPALPDMSMTSGSSPFAVPAETTSKSTNRDTVLHQGILNKTYRIAATPLAKRKQNLGQDGPFPVTPTLRWASAANGTPSSDEDDEPKLRAEIFSSPIRRTPGVSVQTPGRRKSVKRDGTRLATQGDVSYHDAMHTRTARSAADIIGWDSDDEDGLDPSPARTLKFDIGENRVLKTPAREASKRIMDDLLLSAGGEMGDSSETFSPSIVQRNYDLDQTF